MVINQGDIFWVDLDEPGGSEPGYTHPSVVIQNNLFNHSGINTTILCGLTSNLKRANIPGNILLEAGEADLSKQSVVIVSQVFTVDKAYLREYIGALSIKRVRQILDGLKLITEPRESPR
jgi:mRNA interferase MazF